MSQPTPPPGSTELARAGGEPNPRYVSASHGWNQRGLGDAPDEALVRASLRGDEDAFAHLVRRYLRQAMAVALEYMPTREDAEDVVQDTFGRVFERLARFDPARSFGPWFFTILRNNARNALKSRRTLWLQIDSLGRNMLVVSATKVEARAGRTRLGDGWINTLKVDDAHAIVTGSDAIMGVAPADYRAMVAKFGRIANRTTVLGTTPDWLAIRQFSLAEGRFLTEVENAAPRPRVLMWLGLGISVLAVAALGWLLLRGS